MGRFEIGSLIALGIAVITGAISFGKLEGRVSGIEREIANPKIVMQEAAKAILEQMETQVEGQREEFDKLLAGVIVLTAGTCDALGSDWRRYEGMDGRFPLGAGQTKEHLERKTTFEIGKTGGAYVHRLIVDEMPEHAHDFHGSEGPKVVDNWHNARGHRDKQRTTEKTGGNQPHENMPPYLVMNFCRKAGKSP